jgi:hypothetical protein
MHEYAARDVFYTFLTIVTSKGIHFFYHIR